MSHISLPSSQRASWCPRAKEPGGQENFGSRDILWGMGEAHIPWCSGLTLGVALRNYTWHCMEYHTYRAGKGGIPS